MKTTVHMLALGAMFGFTVAASTVVASAQQSQPIRIRGSIEAIDGPLLTVRNRDGRVVQVKLTQNARISGVVQASLADVKQNSFVGVTSVPSADGPARALEVHIFPETARGTGEGSMPYDLAPQSAMTNAAVAQRVANVDGETITLKYKDGEKTVLVPPQTPIVTFAAADRNDLKSGAKVVVFRATELADGSYEAASIQVGLNGVTPPM